MPRYLNDLLALAPTGGSTPFPGGGYRAGLASLSGGGYGPGLRTLFGPGLFASSDDTLSNYLQSLFAPSGLQSLNLLGNGESSLTGGGLPGGNLFGGGLGSLGLGSSYGLGALAGLGGNSYRNQGFGLLGPQQRLLLAFSPPGTPSALLGY